MTRTIKFEGRLQVSLTDEQLDDYRRALEQLLKQTIQYCTRFGPQGSEYRVYAVVTDVRAAASTASTNRCHPKLQDLALIQALQLDVMTIGEYATEAGTDLEQVLDFIDFDNVELALHSIRAATEHALERLEELNLWWGNQGKPPPTSTPLSGSRPSGTAAAPSPREGGVSR